MDVGCGTGFLIDLLTKQRPARYMGVDLSGEMIRAAKVLESRQIQAMIHTVTGKK